VPRGCRPRCAPLTLSTSHTSSSITREELRFAVSEGGPNPYLAHTGALKGEQMRRILLTIAGMAALALTAPGVALAGSHHHRHHFKRHAHARVSFRHLGPAEAGASGPNTMPSSGSTATPAPTTPAPTTTEENAGEVTSYTGGVLTLTLGDHSTVSGKVTVNTRFNCISATAPPTSGDTDDEPGSGDDNGAGDDQVRGDRNQQGGPSSQDGQQGPQANDQWQQGDDGESGPGDDQDDEAPISSEPPCDSSALKVGAKVRAAELRIAPPGAAEFEWITLVG
jgi:hypothetical protein